MLRVLFPGSLRGGEGWTIRPPQAGGDRDVPAFSSGQDALSKSPASPPRTRSGEGRVGRRAGCPLFLVTFSLGKQRKSNSLSGRRAKPSPLGRDNLAIRQQPSADATGAPAHTPGRWPCRQASPQNMLRRASAPPTPSASFTHFAPTPKRTRACSSAYSLPTAAKSPAA
jgi:hypothetical protein